jgi:mRNA deadenylase 3'-5' endonuclease subunit Ccr4
MGVCGGENSENRDKRKKKNNGSNNSSLEITNDYITYSKPKSKQDKTFTVLSYNILAQKYIYSMVKDFKCLEKKIRLDNIVKEIKSINPEIFCLQEATDDIIASHIIKKFEKEYNLIYHNNEGSPLKNVIGVNKNRFEVINESKIIICDGKEKKASNDNNDDDENNSNSENNDDNFFNNIQV